MNGQNPLNWLWPAEICHQKSFFLTFEIIYFFENKCWVTIGKNRLFSKSEKKLFHLLKFTSSQFLNLFRIVLMFKAVNFTYFEKSSKNKLLVNQKKRKMGIGVFKKIPSKSGINKLPLFCQFRPACEQLENSDGKFLRTD